MNNRTEEINSYFGHGDYSLAVRRMLDLSLDSGNHTLMQNAVNWSKTHRGLLKDQSTETSPEFRKEFGDLMNQFSSITLTDDVSTTSLVVADGISKSYGEGNFSLHPIDLQLYASNVLGIVGENGNGKTTLLRCMAGQLALDSGTLSFPALDKPDYYGIKNHVAFIQQRIPRWFGRLKDNLHFSAALAGVTGKENELMVEFMLERFNLSEFAHLTWERISSGYRTRFEIARILLQKPALLILDEPLANLDINAQQTILTDLRFMAKSAVQPMGILLSSQQLHEVEKVADTVLLIKQGKCTFRTGEDPENKAGYALEVETTASREQILSLLREEHVHVKFNGGFYTITSEHITVNEIIKTLLTNAIQVSYFRDITHSTKRYF